MTLALDQLISKDDDALLANVGEALVAQDFGLGDTPKVDLVKAGRNWMESKKGALCGFICQHPVVCKAAKMNTLSKDVIALIVDILEHNAIAISPVPPASAGLLFVRLGYHRICGDAHN